MGSVEKRLKLLDEPEEKEEPFSEDERGQILALSEKLAQPEVSAEARLAIAAQIRLVLLGGVKSISVEVRRMGQLESGLLEPPLLLIEDYTTA